LSDFAGIYNTGLNVPMPSLQIARMNTHQVKKNGDFSANFDHLWWVKIQMSKLVVQYGTKQLVKMGLAADV
jgi:hypothetical protein